MGRENEGQFAGGVTTGLLSVRPEKQLASCLGGGGRASSRSDWGSIYLTVYLLSSFTDPLSEEVAYI